MVLAHCVSIKGENTQRTESQCKTYFLLFTSQLPKRFEKHCSLLSRSAFCLPSEVTHYMGFLLRVLSPAKPGC